MKQAVQRKIKCMAKPPPETYQLDLARYELRRGDGVKVKLERQPMELLILLAGRKGTLVTRDEVAARLWPVGISVDTEPAINNAIRKIRAALRDSPEQPTHLETVVGKGYRFIGDLDVIGPEPPLPKPPPEFSVVSDLPAQAAPVTPNRRLTLALAGIAVLLAGIAGSAVWRTSNRGAIRSLAVLPLQNLSGDPGQDYFADGITDELTTDLAKIDSLRVISRSSTLQYAEHRKAAPQIARELNVDSVLEGSVVRVGNKVRVTAQLIDARRDAHLWAQSYERDLGEILDLQDTVARDIASQVRARLSPETRGAFSSHRPVNPEAYEAYLRGRNELGKQSKEAIRKSVQYFQRAIDLDPFYATGYAGLADAFSLMANYGVIPEKEAFPRAEAAARKALDLDPLLGEAHASLGFAEHHFDWNWAGAETEYRRAIQLSPGFALAHLRYAEYLSNSGRHEEAIREINKARDLDPLSLTIGNNVGRVLFFARRYDDTIRQMKAVLSLYPDRVWARVHLANAYDQQQKYPEAIAEFQRVKALLGGDGIGLANAYAAAGQAAAARRILRNAETPSPDKPGGLDWFFIAGVYTALGDKDKAFNWLDQAYDNRDFYLTELKVTPSLDPLRSDPRMKALYRKIGLQD